MRAHQDRRGGAQAREGASQHRAFASRPPYGIHTGRRGGDGNVTNPAGEAKAVERRLSSSAAEGARSIVRKELGIEFEGFTYPDRTLNIEVAYDFRKHGYTERNYISDPDEWSNLFHWKGPPDRWRVHFPDRARGRTETR